MMKKATWIFGIVVASLFISVLYLLSSFERYSLQIAIGYLAISWISSKIYVNYAKKYNKNNTPQTPLVEVKVKWSDIVWRLFLILQLFCIGIGAIWAIAWNRPLAEDQFTTIQGVLTINPSAYPSTISIYLKQYPKFVFVATSNAFSGMAVNDFIDDAKPGDTVTLSISKETYEKEISNGQLLKSTDKPGDYSVIRLFSLSNAKYDYLTLDHYIDLENTDNANPDKSGDWILIVGALIFFGLSFYLMKKEVIPLYRKYKEQHGVT